MKTTLALLCIVASAFAAPTKPAQCGYDVVFVMESSELIGEETFPLMRNFVTDFLGAAMSNLPLQWGEGLQAAVVRFSSKLTNLAIGLGTEHYISSFNNALSKVSYIVGDDFVQDGLLVAGSKPLVDADRPAFPNLVVLLSQGVTPGDNVQIEALAQATKLRKAGATILVVGVKGFQGINQNNLLSLAGNVTANYADIDGDWQTQFFADDGPILAANPACRKS